MPGLDQMSEQELLGELRDLANECVRLNFELAHVGQRQRFCRDRPDAVEAAQREQALLGEMNRLMDRGRAIEGHLMRVRGRLRPLREHE